MNVVVCIKQVPEKSVPMDGENGVLDRSRSGSRMNPWDGYALEAGLRLARSTGGTVTALSMGPDSAGQSLKTALAMGADRAVLLCDRAFAGADVYATAYTLARGIEALGRFDLVLCGQQTTDGDTAQLPFSLGVRLGLPVLGWVKKLELTAEGLTADQELSLGTQRAEIKDPCVLAVGEGVGTPRIPTLRDQLSARKKQVQRLSLSDLSDQNGAHYGLAASPTHVAGVRETAEMRKSEPLTLSPEEAAKLLLQSLSACSGEAEA